MTTSTHDDKSSDAAKCKRVVVVCSHGIWTGGTTNGRDEREWLLEPFQAGESSTFYKHTEAGLQVIRKDKGAMLVFSGGATKPHITDLSEGQSYHDLATNLAPDLASRMRAECFATDSFQNVLFSLLLFHQETGAVPEQMTLVSHAFKRARFIDQHCPTLRWPVSRVNFIGIDPDKDIEGQRLIASGEARARAQWQQDPWGWGPDLGRKRRQRGWKEHSADKLLAPDLIRWRGGQTGTQPFAGSLPWGT